MWIRYLKSVHDYYSWYEAVRQKGYWFPGKLPKFKVAHYEVRGKEIVLFNKVGIRVSVLKKDKVASE